MKAIHEECCKIKQCEKAHAHTHTQYNTKTQPKRNEKCYSKNNNNCCMLLGVRSVISAESLYLILFHFLLAKEQVARNC